jgi:hypothetical protein
VKAPSIRDKSGEVVGVSFDGEASESLGVGRDELDADLEDVLGARKKRTLDDDFLRKVAQIYREAHQSLLSTQAEIQRQLGPVSDATARRWVWLARKKGFLDPAIGPWKAGEKGDASG